MLKDSFYLIEGSVEFHFEKHFFYSRTTARKLNLQVPASSCLEKLIINQGKVTSQTELLSAGWGERATNITMNAFYQTILQLRRTLALIGIQKDFIKTVNRRGLIIYDEWDISLHQKNEFLSQEKKPCPQKMAHPVRRQKKNINCGTALISLFFIPSWLNMKKRDGLLLCSFLTLILSALTYFTLDVSVVSHNHYIINTSGPPVECLMFFNEKDGVDKINSSINKLSKTCEGYLVVYNSK